MSQHHLLFSLVGLFVEFGQLLIPELFELIELGKMCFFNLFFLIGHKAIGAMGYLVDVLGFQLFLETLVGFLLECLNLHECRLGLNVAPTSLVVSHLFSQCISAKVRWSAHVGVHTSFLGYLPIQLDRHILILQPLCQLSLRMSARVGYSQRSLNKIT
jgi:hypothetical protein